MRPDVKPPDPDQAPAERCGTEQARSSHRRLIRAFASVRPSALPYMLIFSLAPVFPDFKDSLSAYSGRILGMDGIFVMGIAFSLGIGLISLTLQPRHLAGGPLSVRPDSVLFLGWILSPFLP